MSKESRIITQPFPEGDANEMDLNVENSIDIPLGFVGEELEKEFKAWVNTLYDLTEEPDDVEHDPLSLDTVRPDHEFDLPIFGLGED